MARPYLCLNPCAFFGPACLIFPGANFGRIGRSLRTTLGGEKKRFFSRFFSCPGGSRNCLRFPSPGGTRDLIFFAACAFNRKCLRACAFERLCVRTCLAVCVRSCAGRLAGF